MRMIDRLTALVRANVSEALDRAEDPEKVLAQILRDMLTSITTARTQVVTLIVQEKELEAEVKQSRQAAENWERKAQAAVASGNDNLARRKRDVESIGSVYEQQLTTHQQVVARFKHQLRQLETKYQTTLAQRDVLIARHKRAIAQAEIAGSLSKLSSADPSAGLERMERNIRTKEAEVAAFTELVDTTFDAQFAALGDPTIEAELLELKAKAFGKPESDAISLDEFRELEPFDIEAELRELKSGL